MECKGLSKGCPDPLHDGKDLFGSVELSKQNQKFITTETGHGIVFPHTPGEPLGYCLEEFIAHFVPFGVVNVLKIIEVHKEDTDHFPGSPGKLDGFFEVFSKKSSVG
jgi:hypothetical protein